MIGHKIKLMQFYSVEKQTLLLNARLLLLILSHLRFSLHICRRTNIHNFIVWGIKLKTFTVLGNLCCGIPVDDSHRPAAALILAQHSAGSSPQ